MYKKTNELVFLLTGAALLVIVWVQDLVRALRSGLCFRALKNTRLKFAIAKVV